MSKLVGSAFLIASLSALGFMAQAKADVIYNLTFQGSSTGTGVLDLNLPSLTAADNLNENIASIFSSVTTTTLDGQMFDITPSNLASGYIDTGASGQAYSLTITQTEPAGDAAGTANTLFLDLYTNSWQIHCEYNSTCASGTFSIGSPQLSTTQILSVHSVPEPVTVSLFGAGLAGVAAFRRRKKSKQV